MLICGAPNGKLGLAKAEKIGDHPGARAAARRDDDRNGRGHHSQPAGGSGSRCGKTSACQRTVNNTLVLTSSEVVVNEGDRFPWARA